MEKTFFLCLQKFPFPGNSSLAAPTPSKFLYGSTLQKVYDTLTQLFEFPYS
jgi:hypothetical protein